MGGRWRTGRKVGRTIYRDDELVGVMDDAHDAARVVELLNRDDDVTALADAVAGACGRGPCSGQSGHPGDCSTASGWSR